MAASSVTGVGPGSCHHALGVSQLIGPRWTEEKEKEFNKLNKTLKYLVFFNVISNIGFGIGALIYYLTH